MTRDHFLGTGRYTQLSNVIPLIGSILGLRVTNLDNQESQHPREAFALHNIPSQVFNSPFVASFYARFDFNFLATFQRVFDFGNGQRDNNILCGQFQNGQDFMCEVWVDDVPHRIIAPDSIVTGEFAFWHFGMEANGTLWIEKDENIVATEQFPGLATARVYLVVRTSRSTHHWMESYADSGLTENNSDIVNTGMVVERS